MLAAQLANFPEIRTVVIDRKDGPLEVGQADGVACRTVEMFEAFGLADRLINEGYWVNEVSFWRPDPQDRTKITRTGRIQDVEEGLSEMPARDRQPGADARLPAGSHGALAQQAAAVLRPARHRHPDRHQRLVGVPGDGHLAAPEGLQGDRRNLHDPGQVRRRLRRLPQRHPDRDRPRAASATR